MVNKDLSQKLVIISYRLFQGHTQAGLGLALTSDSVRISPKQGCLWAMQCDAVPASESQQAQSSR